MNYGYCLTEADYFLFKIKWILSHALKEKSPSSTNEETLRTPDQMK
jgi:hypothetical protein